MGFRDDFAWGVATASYQNEGGAEEDNRGLSIWDVYSHEKGHIVDGQTGDITSDQYHRIGEDIGIMKELSMNAYRLSISWPRVLPNGIGAINEKGLDFYDRMVDQLLEAGITPYVTLYHWDLPYELYKKGGWLNPDMPKWFAEYTNAVVRRLSDRVRHWITQNEPQCFIGLGMETGEHAPGLQLNKKDYLQAAHHALLAHGQSVKTIRDEAKIKPTIGYATALLRMWSPVSSQEDDIEACRRCTFETSEDPISSNTWWLDPIFFGEYPKNGIQNAGPYMPEIGPDDMKLISQPLDFLGLNVYQTAFGKAAPDGSCIKVEMKPGYARTSYPWPVTPQAMYWAPRFFSERYHKQIVITENGMSNSDWISLDGGIHDPQRIDFTQRYLQQLKKVAEEGIDIGGYFHWTLTDNFEWSTGFTNRFGLVYVDFETGERTVKDSGFWYKKVIETNGEML